MEPGNRSGWVVPSDGCRDYSGYSADLAIHSARRCRTATVGTTAIFATLLLIVAWGGSVQLQIARRGGSPVAAIIRGHAHSGGTGLDVATYEDIEISSKERCSRHSYSKVPNNVSSLQCTCDCSWAAENGTCDTHDTDCCWSCCCLVWRPRLHLSTKAAAEKKDGVPDAKSEDSENVVIPDASKAILPFVEGCLCVFDVDRTLTGVQGQTKGCPGNTLLKGVADLAYGGGNLTLSPAGKDIRKTFCGKCFIGLISAWSVASEAKRRELAERLEGMSKLPNRWSKADKIESPLVMGCGDSEKADCVKGVANWYRLKGIVVKPRSVYVFDDNSGIADGLDKFGFNFRQVSCAIRDAAVASRIGFCGATLEEIVPSKGVHLCE